jgi:hypothetical protein
MQNKKLVIIAVVLVMIILVFSYVGYFTQSKNNEDYISANLIVNTLGNKKLNNYTGQSITALDLLKKYWVVNTSSSKYGEFVNCIGNVCSSDSYYWMYYVNGNMAPVGAGEYSIRDNDSIEFIFDK